VRKHFFKIHDLFLPKHLQRAAAKYPITQPMKMPTANPIQNCHAEEGKRSVESGSGCVSTILNGTDKKFIIYSPVAL